MAFSIRGISEKDKANSFSMGSDKYKTLKSFIKKRAKDLHTSNITKTYVLVDDLEPDVILGYMSLVCSEINLDKKQKPRDSKFAEKYDTFPAVKLAKLAIDKRHRCKGSGVLLTKTAIGIIIESIMPWVGCRYFIVDSKPNAIKFYEKIGFCLLEHPDNRSNTNPLMLLDIHTIK